MSQNTWKMIGAPTLSDLAHPLPGDCRSWALPPPQRDSADQYRRPTVAKSSWLSPIAEDVEEDDFSDDSIPSSDLEKPGREQDDGETSYPLRFEINHSQPDLTTVETSELGSLSLSDPFDSEGLDYPGQPVRKELTLPLEAGGFWTGQIMCQEWRSAADISKRPWLVEWAAECMRCDPVQTHKDWDLPFPSLQSASRGACPGEVPDHLV